MHSQQQQIQTFTNEERYGYLIRKVTDTQVIWLISDGRSPVMLSGDGKQILIPVWPEQAFAAAMLEDAWEHHRAQSMPLDSFLQWLGVLQEEHIGIACFPLTDLQGVVVSAADMRQKLREELRRYE